MNDDEDLRPKPTSDGAPVDPNRPGEIDRRTALKLLGASGAALTVVPHLPALWGGRAAPRRALFAASSGDDEPELLVPSLSVDVTRRDDMFNLQFDFYNLQLNTAPAPELVRINAHDYSYLVVTFPMQHIGEDTIAYDPSSPPPWPNAPLSAYAAGPSQLVFSVPAVQLPIPFTMAGILNWPDFVPQLTAAAAARPDAVPAAPGQLQTYIEAPWHLFLSPDTLGRWHHASEPVTHGSWTELWQTRLARGAVEPPAALPNIRAIWTPGWPEATDPDPFLLPLENQDRVDIVTLSSGGTDDQTGLPVKGVPMPATLFMLTSLGASMNLNGRWNEPSVSTLIQYQQRMATGRDSYVRLVRSGFIYPFGHKAVQISVDNRQFQVSQDGTVTAYLVQENFIEITELTKTYSGAPEAYAGRQNPLRTIVSKTALSPPLDDPLTAVSGSVPVTNAFWATSVGTPVPFHFQGIDLEGRTVDFSTSVIWVDEDTAQDTTPSGLLPLIADAWATATPSWITPPLGGQLVAFAHPTTTEPGATAHHAVAIEWGANLIQSPSAPVAHQPAWYPAIMSAQLRIPAAEQVSGSELPGTPPVFDYAGPYLENGFEVGVPQVFMWLDASSTAAPLTFPADKSGGMVTPNFMIDGISRQHGPTADSKNLLMNSEFNPASYFAGLEAKILGGLDLVSILEKIVGAGASAKVPKIKAKLVFPHNNHSLAPSALLVTVTWGPVVSGDPIGFFVPDGSTSNTLKVSVKINVPFADPSATTFQITGQLVNFDINLFGTTAKGGLNFLDLHFTKVHFVAKTGAKTHFDVNVSKVTFGDCLSFLTDLEQFLASLGGPSIDLQPTGITVSYTLPLPDVTVGVFSLENISIGGMLTLPFDGTPVRLEIDFCTRENPFILSIYCFAGGGFFGISLGIDGIELLEVSLEFGAAVALNLGVASGGVSIMAGIYFSMASNPNVPPITNPPSEIVTLTGFLQANGNLEVLGIISISVVFYLGFTYEDPGKCTGTCTVTVSVSVLCFSASVSMTVTKTFGGTGSDPTFAQAISQAEWDTYCDAFA